jgi:hypothetical protein
MAYSYEIVEANTNSLYSQWNELSLQRKAPINQVWRQPAAYGLGLPPYTMLLYGRSAIAGFRESRHQPCSKTHRNQHGKLPRRG